MVGEERRWRGDCERTLRWGRMVVQMVKGLLGQSGPGKLERLAEGENHRCDSLVLLGRSSGCLTTWLELNHCGCPLVEGVVNHVGEAVEVSAGGIREEEILLGVVNEVDVVGIALDELAELLERLGVNLHRRASEVEIQLAFDLDAFDERSHVMRLERGPVICLQSGGVANGSALLELADSCHPLVGIEAQNRVMESTHVSHTVHVAVKQACHGKVNVAAGYRQVGPVSLAEGNEL